MTRGTSRIPRSQIVEVPFDKDGLIGLIGLREKQREPREGRRKYIFDYPTVYVIAREDDGGFNRGANHRRSPKYSVYVGETSDIYSRTKQHLKNDPKSPNKEYWRAFLEAADTKMHVIANPHFNKSLTLDIENRLILYLFADDAVASLNNRRLNPQGNYYTRDELDEIFAKIWQKLGSLNPKLFPSEQLIRDSALFKASPFHKLTEEQLDARQRILESIQEALESDESGHLILVKGEAGSGKTVLLSTLFLDLLQMGADGSRKAKDDEESAQDLPAESDDASLDAHILVNQNDQLKVYQGVIRKLGLLKRGECRVWKPTPFIKKHAENSKVDVVLVDEAHLLLTTGKQSYQGNNQWLDLLKRARVVVAVYDENQTRDYNQVVEPRIRREVDSYIGSHKTTILLKNQMRMDAEEPTISWVHDFVNQRVVKQVPTDRRYDLRIFSSVREMYAAIKRKNNLGAKARKNDENWNSLGDIESASDINRGLSRLLATYDWKYSGKSANSNDPEGIWFVNADGLKLPWNGENLRQRPGSIASGNRTDLRVIKNLPWAEQPQTINEVGSTNTIQGFDLNYAGVILGPSITYRDGHVVIDESKSQNHWATNRRKHEDGNKVSHAEELLENDLNVLLTRGVHGLYIYAVDPALRDVLLKADRRGTGSSN